EARVKVNWYSIAETGAADCAESVLMPPATAAVVRRADQSRRFRFFMISRKFDDRVVDPAQETSPYADEVETVSRQPTELQAGDAAWPAPGSTPRPAPGTWAGLGPSLRPRG